MEWLKFPLLIVIAYWLLFRRTAKKTEGIAVVPLREEYEELLDFQRKFRALVDRDSRRDPLTRFLQRSLSEYIRAELEAYDSLVALAGRSPFVIIVPKKE